ncbi:reverse transcriptase [Plasmopara halstedii]|uniref:Reverse transcriptase n=1 Tax=Plasmopara halstedii TaxID=4781 RepID=A0A0P1AGC8_PLAHL|nr:reverse transcriptase [Plasmopara halstedii]CEG39618.1 reverse transcriptase [Plasmopara halstedii]|eukprot:XP_024575987.1 reverse transcriptase [Plasmopara halstedii]
MEELERLEAVTYDDQLQDLKCDGIEEVVLLSYFQLQSRMTQLLTKFDSMRIHAEDWVAKPSSGLPPEREARHENDRKPSSKHVVLRQLPLSRDQSEFIDDIIAQKQAAGFVRDSKCAPMFCVRKPNGTRRIAHAYNKLNAQTIPAQTPISRKAVIIHRMSGCTQFSALDLIDGYYQILVWKEDVPLTTVSTSSDMLWEWLVIPQGLSNAAATLRRFAQTYFNDIFVHLKNENGRLAEE